MRYGPPPSILLPAPSCCWRERLKPAVFGLLLTAAFLAGPAPALRADGVILVPVAAPPVTMPDQRALLIWHEKEQTETLVIESRFAGAGHDFAWVVPLPSKPEVKPATSGTLPALAASFRPAIAKPWELTPDLCVGLAPLAVLALFFGVGLGIRIYLRCWAVFLVGLGLFLVSSLFFEEQGPGAAGFSVLILGTLFGAAVILWQVAGHKMAWGWIVLPLGVFGLAIAPAFQHVRGDSDEPVPAGVQVERSTVGGYDVALLSGSSADGIIQWLHDHQFALPAAASPVVAEHTADGGYFVATRLRREADNPLPTAPAPLVFTFKTPRPVYPMKLTGTGATRPLDLELFVFGDQRASVNGLAVQACAPVEFSAALPDGAARKSPETVDTIQLSHPALRSLCAGTTVATHLTGTFSPGRMDRDLTVLWQPFTKTEGLLKYVRADMAWRALVAATAVLIWGVLVIAVRCGLRRPPALPACAVFLAAAIAAGAAWSSRPTVPIVYGVPMVNDLELATLRELTAAVDQDVFDLKMQKPTETQLHEVFQRAVKEGKYYLPQIHEGDAPGDYRTIRLPDGTWQIDLIDHHGREIFARP